MTVERVQEGDRNCTWWGDDGATLLWLGVNADPVAPEDGFARADGVGEVVGDGWSGWWVQDFLIVDHQGSQYLIRPVTTKLPDPARSVDKKAAATALMSIILRQR